MTAPHYADDAVTVYHGDCRDILATLPDASVDAVVTDPPYELGFMSRSWDNAGIAYDPDMWAACLRVLRPGGHLLAFGGTRTYHRMTCAIEDAGAEIRDSIHWIYGSGFPKSLDVSKAIDKAAGAEREVVGQGPFASRRPRADHASQGVTFADDAYVRPAGHDVTAPATADAAQWSGWGTALKPAHEPIVVARRPLDGTVAANVLTHGTGGLNIDGCRVGLDGEKPPTGSGGPNTRNSMAGGVMHGVGGNVTPAAGRWPANIVLTHPPALDEHGEIIGDACADGCVPGCPIAEMDAQSGTTTSRASAGRNGNDMASATFGLNRTRNEVRGHDDQGGASRFFPTFRYQAKAGRRERPTVDGVTHPTVKPIALMRWLCRLVTPPGGLILDPFLGSGTTAQAARAEGFRCIGVEYEAAHLPLITARLTAPAQLDLAVEAGDPTRQPTTEEKTAQCRT